MPGEAFLGLDIGGTGVKAGLYDASGRCLGFARRSCTPEASADGHVEISIQRLEAAAQEVVREVLAGGANFESVRAMSISSQGQTFVPLDVQGRPLHPAILWYDSRAQEQAGRLRAATGAEVEAIASAAKIMWLRENRPQAAAAAYYLLLPDYFAFRLTGEAVTDPETAASTGLCCPDHGGYAPAALEAAGLCVAQLARIQRPGSVIAPLNRRAAEAWGLSPEALLVVGTNDQYAGALGAGNHAPGVLSETTGTCLALVTLVRQLPSPLVPGLLGGAFPIAPYSFLLAYIKTAGVLLDWLSRELTAGRGVEELVRLAADVPAGSRGVLLLPHFDGAVSPKPAAGARGVIAGLSLHHGIAEVFRAALEGVCFSLRQNVEFLEQWAPPLAAIRCIGGGARSDLWLQMKADVLGRAVEKPAVTEAATLGAAMLAAVGAGVFASLEEASRRLYRVQRIFEPHRDRHVLYNDVYNEWLSLQRQFTR